MSFGSARVWRIAGLAGALACGFGLGCKTGDDGAASDDANITSTACQVFNNQTGKPLTAAELKELNDLIVKKLLAGKDCPTTYTAALKKLKENDSKDCDDPSEGTTTDGLGTFLVNEKVAHMSEADAEKETFRTVTIKTCDKRKTDEMLFSSFASAQRLPDTNVEMIGKDATSGVFNYYEVIDGGQWVFYGDSFDFIGEGYTCKPSGACVANNSRKASSPTRKSCASCHISGGLVMKELDAPWLHWTGELAKGSATVAEKHRAKLGKPQFGENLETQVVRPSFEAYNQKRAMFLATKGVTELLRPVFCTLDINLSSEFVGAGLIADGSLADVTPNPDFDLYDELKKQVKQRINGIPKADDTADAFTYPTKGQIDGDYVAQLLDGVKLIDEELLMDIRSVDFTRPLFSGLRCGLVDTVKDKAGPVDAKLAAFAKEKDKKARDKIAGELRKEIPALYASVLEKKSGKTPAEALFLQNLTDPKATAEAHRTRANAFSAKCNARWSADEEKDKEKRKAAFLELMTFASHVRTQMRTDVVGFNGQDLLEGHGRDNKMVVDDIPDNPNAFDPDDCKLVLPPNALRVK